jgi:hypothetical protein
MYQYQELTPFPDAGHGGRVALAGLRINIKN